MLEKEINAADRRHQSATVRIPLGRGRTLLLRGASTREMLKVMSSAAESGFESAVNFLAENASLQLRGEAVKNSEF